MSEKKKITLYVDEEHKDIYDKIPWGIRSEVCRALLVKVAEAADKNGTMIFGAIIDGNFELKYKKGAKHEQAG